MKKIVYTAFSGAALTLSLLLNSCVSNADSPD